MLAKRHEVYSRLYPSVLGTLGRVGDAIVIARRALKEDGVSFALGYIGPSFGLFLIAHHPFSLRTKVNWSISTQVGLASAERLWVIAHLDKVTRRALEKDKERLKKLIAFRERKALKEKALKNHKRAVLAAKRRLLNQKKRLKKQWTLSILENLVAIENGIKTGVRQRYLQSLIPKELDLTAESWNWL